MTVYPAGMKGGREVVPLEQWSKCEESIGELILLVCCIRVCNMCGSITVREIQNCFLVWHLYFWGWGGGGPLIAVLKIKSWRECSTFRRSWICRSVLIMTDQLKRLKLERTAITPMQRMLTVDVTYSQKKCLELIEYHLTCATIFAVEKAQSWPEMWQKYFISLSNRL